MDLFGWLGMVVFCSWSIRESTDGMGRKMLTELNGVSLILGEMGCWDIVLCIWPYLLYSLFFPYLWQD